MAHVDVTATELGTHVTGTVGLRGERPFDLSGVVNTADSALAAHLGAVDVEVGAMDLQAHATGSLNEPSLTSLDVTANRLDVNAAGISTTIQPGAHLVWQPSSLAVTGLRAAFGNTTMDVSGALDGRADHQLSARIKGRLDDLRPAARALLGPSFDRAVIEGPLDVTVTASGTPDRPSVVGSLAVDAATVGDGVQPSLTNVWVRTVLDHDVVRIDLAELQWQGAHTAISGSIPAWFFGVPGASQGGRAALRGHLDDVTIKVLEPLVSADALGATDFNIRVEYLVEATAPAFEAITADARVTDAVIRSRDLSLEQQGVGHLTLRKGIATLDPWTVAAKATTSTQVTVGGSATLIGTPSVDAKVDGRLDLRTLSLLFGTVPAGGHGRRECARQWPADEADRRRLRDAGGRRVAGAKSAAAAERYSRHGAFCRRSDRRRAHHRHSERRNARHQRRDATAGSGQRVRGADHRCARRAVRHSERASAARLMPTCDSPDVPTAATASAARRRLPTPPIASRC